MSSRSSSLARMPVSVLGCTCISIASSPGEMPGNSPMSRRANRWGPVTPRPRSMRFEVRCRWWSSAHSSCMNCKTSGRTSPSSNGGRVDRPRRVVDERRGLTDVMTATRRHRDCRPHLLYRSSLAPSAVHGPPRDGRNRQPSSAAEQEQGEEPHDSSSDRKPCDTLRSCPRLQGSAAATQQAPSAPLTLQTPPALASGAPLFCAPAVRRVFRVRFRIQSASWRRIGSAVDGGASRVDAPLQMGGSRSRRGSSTPSHTRSRSTTLRRTHVGCRGHSGSTTSGGGMHTRRRELIAAGLTVTHIARIE